MKYIIAIIQPHKLEEVKAALEDVEVHLITVSNVLGRGRQKGITEVYRGAKEIGSLLKKIKIEIAVNEDFVKPAVAALTKERANRRDWRRENFHPGSQGCDPHQNRRIG